MSNRFNIQLFGDKNALIATFDGLQVIQRPKTTNNPLGVSFRTPNYYPFCQMDDEQNTGWIDSDAHELEYHERWDWLMLPVEKIRKVKVQTHTISEASEWANLQTALNAGLQAIDLISVYNAVVGIIMFINKQNNDKTASV